jgi:DNA-nicking Smr family endonuclease
MSAEGDDDDAEDELTRALPDIKPLRGRARVGRRVPSEARIPSTAPVFQITSAGARLNGRVAGLDERVVARLHRSEPEARLDLHGLQPLAAQRAVVETIEGCRAKGQRRLLIVHGRGMHSRDGVARLREEMTSWLTGTVAAIHVLAFTSAPPRLGGLGAVLVLLRAPASFRSDA